MSGAPGETDHVGSVALGMARRQVQTFLQVGQMMGLSPDELLDITRSSPLVFVVAGNLLGFTRDELLAIARCHTTASWRRTAGPTTSR